MTDLAKEAVAAALNFEAIKDGCKQRQSGDYVVSFRIANADTPSELLSANMGQRYICAIVPIDGEEKPMQQAWKISNQAALLCTKPTFKTFLHEEHNVQKWASDEECAEFVREFCGVDSRSKLDTDENARKQWLELKQQYEAWIIRDDVV